MAVFGATAMLMIFAVALFEQKETRADLWSDPLATKGSSSEIVDVRDQLDDERRHVIWQNPFQSGTARGIAIQNLVVHPSSGASTAAPKAANHAAVPAAHLPISLKAPAASHTDDTKQDNKQISKPDPKDETESTPRERVQVTAIHAALRCCHAL